MKGVLNPLNFRHVAADLSGGVTTAIISLPLALTFGVASGAGPQAGLYGAILVGLFAALFGGSTRLISEPTGPMTVIMTAVIASLTAAYPDDGLAMAFTVVMLAGLFQMLIGALRLGKFITLMPYAVISGFMSGIGVILILIHVPPFLGHATQPGGLPGMFANLPELARDIRWSEFLLAVFALVALLAYPARLSRFVPPQLLVLLIGTLLSLVWLDADSLRRIGSIPMGLPDFQIPTFTQDQMTRIFVDAAVLGTLGAVDTLLTAMIADSLTRDYHASDKELIGQGLGNLAAGFCGGLPGAGATMGTVANIQAGARSNLAGVTRALLLLLVALWAAPLTSPIPMAILAAIAVKVGLDILDWSFLKRAHRISGTATFIMYGVLLLTVLVDLIVAVGLGVFIANILTIQRLSDLQDKSVNMVSVPGDSSRVSEEEARLLSEAKGKMLLFHLSGPVIFSVAKAISRQHAAIQDEEVRVLIVDLQRVPMMGVTVSLAIENMILDARDAGAQVFITGAQGTTRDRLQKMGVFRQPGVNEAATRLEAMTVGAALTRPSPNAKGVAPESVVMSGHR